VWESEFHKPLGLSSSFTWDNADEVWAYGSVGTARDYARVGQLMLNRGKWRKGGKEGEEYEIVSEAFIQQVLIHRVTRPFVLTPNVLTPNVLTP
jgi:CubicO group peptidase (beta-lactamase class C family)